MATQVKIVEAAMCRIKNNSKNPGKLSNDQQNDLDNIAVTVEAKLVELRNSVDKSVSKMLDSIRRNQLGMLREFGYVI